MEPADPHDQRRKRERMTSTHSGMTFRAPNGYACRNRIDPTLEPLSAMPRWIAWQCEPGEHILDVGCGYGTTSLALSISERVGAGGIGDRGRHLPADARPRPDPRCACCGRSNHNSSKRMPSSMHLR